MDGAVNPVLARLCAQGQPFSSAQVCAEARVSRQAVHKHLRRLVARGLLTVQGKARAARYRATPQRVGPQPVVPLHQRVEVASAGSLYRLSARLLLLEVAAGEVVVDFTGVEALGEEFLEELFLVWAPLHPKVTLTVAHVPAKLAPQFFAFAKQAAARGSQRRAG
jgi:biotin operon repressor